DAFTTAIGYTAMTFWLSGTSTPAALSPAALTSVTYTMVASASPDVTLARADFTSSSCDFGLTVTPAEVSACWLYVPAGTLGSTSTTRRSASARSAGPVMCLGLPG